MNGASSDGSRGSWIVLGLVAVALVYGVWELFRLRFARGDIYPAYSSLRADQLGTRALADGLARAGIAVGRHHEQLDRRTLPEATWYVAGLRWNQFSTLQEKDWRALLAMVEAGGRLVVSFSAPALRTFEEALDDEIAAEKKKRDREEEHRDEDDTEPDANERLLAHLGLPTVRVTTADEAIAERHPDADPSLPESLPWHTRISVGSSDDAWLPLYVIRNTPVAATRQWGRGTIVLVGDSYLLSNEALSRERATEWLVWLQGSHPRAVFDEFHLGVEQAHGVATLARRYGLTHTAFVLVAIGLLFVWKNNSALVPAAPAPQTSADSTGRDSAAGFVNLLRRTLAPSAVFATSLAEFRRSPAWRRLTTDAQRSLAELESNSDHRDPVAATREAHARLARKG